MKKRILSLLLTVAMMLSVMTILPLSANAEVANTFNASDASPIISTAADLVAFAAAVDGGNNFSGKTVKLAADIDLSGVENFSDIGAASSKPFSGSFDGQGHAITNFKQSMGKFDGQGGLFAMVRVPANGTVEIKNFTIDGTMTYNITGDSYCVGTVVSCLDAGTDKTAKGTFTMQNVRSSVTIQVNGSSGTVYGVGGLLGFTRHATDVTDLTVNIDSCVYDGNMNFGRITRFVGGIMGTAGRNVSNRDVTINITNTVFAGNINLPWYSTDVATIACLTRDQEVDNKGGLIVANITDCISAGKIFFQEEQTYDSYEFGIACSTVYGDVLKMNVKNLYYVPFGIPSANASGERIVEIVQEGKNANNYTCDANSGAKTLDEISALTAADFSENAKFSFKANTALDTYYPCPTGLVKEGAWVDCLKVSVDAKVEGAQIRITAENDPYSGIRFVANFRETANTTGKNTADANFGLILISAANYKGETTIADLLAAGGVQVAATKTTEADGVITVKAVIYEIAEEYYNAGIVAIPYANGQLIGAAVERSIYSVAKACVEANNDSALALAFAQQIVATVEAA